MSQERTWKPTVRLLDKSLDKYYFELKKLPEYSKAVAPIFNDAIRVGLPILYEKIYGEIKVEDDKIDSKMYDLNVSDKLVMDRMLALLQEINMNVILTRSTIYSIFGLYENELENKEIVEKLRNGELSDTPEYLKDYEDYAISEFTKG